MANENLYLSGENKYSIYQLSALLALRVAIGWHFLYEGVAKLLNPNWSSVAYLLDSKGFLSEFYFALASDPTIIKIVDFLNIWGLIAIGLGLILGFYARIAIIGGITLLALYYLSHIPFYTLRYSTPSEGSYLLVNKTLVEMLALIVLFTFPTSTIIGIDRFRKIVNKKNQINI